MCELFFEFCSFSLLLVQSAVEEPEEAAECDDQNYAEGDADCEADCARGGGRDRGGGFRG